MNRVLLTGVGGFLGGLVLDYLKEKTDWSIIGLDSFRHRGSLARVRQDIDLVFHDLSVPICPMTQDKLLKGGEIDFIIHLASDSAVERSISDPVAALRNNFEVGLNMLEFARKHPPKLFLQFSTDEVYGEATTSGHAEWSSIVPSNPYAASKACQEAMAIAYWRSYGMPLVILNAMNIIGPRQDPEKFVPKIINYVRSGKEMPIYGEAGRIGSRCYVDARDVASAIHFVSGLPVQAADGVAPRPNRFNVCGKTEIDNLQMAQAIAKLLGRELNYKLIPSESARKGYDRRYMLDGSKLSAAGWRHQYTLEETLAWILSEEKA
jgi:dTDP-glucose 4,6-dehydratase